MTWHCGNHSCPMHNNPTDQCPGWRMAAIRTPVGTSGNPKSYQDIRVIQGALNRFPASCGGPDPKLNTDGIHSPILIEAIKTFQRMFFGTTKPDGRVDVAGQTNKALARQLKMKRISVNLSEQIVCAVENGCILHQFNCVTGDARNATRPGVFAIFKKDKIHRSTQFNVQMNFAMFFDHGKALHQYHGIVPLRLVRFLKSGTDFFGSHGCVRLEQADAEKLFNFAPLNTRVTIF
jgi:hypothetical protein